MRTSLLAPITALLLSAGAAADTIHLTTGSTIDDVKIQTEALDVVTYKKARKTETVPTRDVLRVTYSTKPELIDQADAAMDEGEWGNAIGDYEAYLAENDEPERSFKWARDYALARRLEAFTFVGTPAQVAEAADDVANFAPTSRFVPQSHATKAEYLFLAGEEAAARAALAPLQALIDGQGLGERWAIQHDLFEVLFDSATQGAARRTKLEGVEKRAKGTYPSLRARCQVAIADSHLLEGAMAKAEPVYRAVTENAEAGGANLAGAWYGLGRCVYERASSKADTGADASAEFEEALLALLRVVVVYDAHRQYAPPAFYYAGRAFDGLGDAQSADRAQKMYRRCIARYPESRWAREARAFRRR